LKRVCAFKINAYYWRLLGLIARKIGKSRGEIIEELLRIWLRKTS